MEKSEFAGFHPFVNFIYFVAVIGFSMVILHPACLAISFASAFVYSVMLKGKKAIKTNLFYMIPLILATAIINPIFNHQGQTVLTTLPDGNLLTLEAIIYGICAAVMVADVICWFSCYNEVMTSDKFIYLFSRVIPVLSLVISMTLRFVPLFVQKLSQTIKLQKLSGSKKGKIKIAASAITTVISRSLENAIDTSDSMRARGYGIPGRTAFSIFKFDKRDALLLLCITALSAYIIIGRIMGAVYFNFYPLIIWADASFYSISVISGYIILCFIPVIIEFWEVRKWKHLTSKI